MEKKQSILFVDDDKNFLKIVSHYLEQIFNVITAESIVAARKSLESNIIHAVLLDMRLGGLESDDTDGLEFLKELRKERPLMPVILMTSYGNIEFAVQAIKSGANDFIEKDKVKPNDIIHVLQKEIIKARKQLQLEAKANEQKSIQTVNLIGDSSIMKSVKKTIKMAATDGYCSVLILGETGTGKEVVARSIHKEGWRNEGPFIPVAVSGLNPNLVESELFGYEKGAFTGADKTKIGYIEQASGGVLFLDEIGDLSTDLQVKLLRFIEERVIYRVGSTKPRPIDVQLICATNLDINKRISEGEFRNDFYYRIKTVEIKIPPLRKRKEDIALLADYFIQILRKQGRTKLAGFSNDAVNALAAYNFPGNVRELNAVIEWAALNAGQSNHWIIEIDDLPDELRNPKYHKGFSQEGYLINIGNELIIDKALATTELYCLNEALKITRGIKSRAEQMLGYSGRHTMLRRIQKIKQSYPNLWENFEHVKKAYNGN